MAKLNNETQRNHLTETVQTAEDCEAVVNYGKERKIFKR